MKRSEKILRRNSIPVGISDGEKTAIENNILLKHVIDRDLNQMWWWIRFLVAIVVGLGIKSFIGG